MDKESPEERLAKVEIKPVEQECLKRVFDYLSMLIKQLGNNINFHSNTLKL